MASASVLRGGLAPRGALSLIDMLLATLSGYEPSNQVRAVDSEPLNDRTKQALWTSGLAGVTAIRLAGIPSRSCRG